MSPLTSSSLPKFLLLLLLLAVPRLGRCENAGQVSEQEHEQQQQEEQQQVVSYTDVQQKYVVVWADAPPKAMKASSGGEDVNIDIKSVNCTSDDDCTAALYDLDLALSYPSNLPTAPYCIYAKNHNNNNNTEVGRCTCGPGRCVSHSHSYSNGGSLFYYCGPCGWVGSQCNNTCSHRLAECVSGYCECIRDGTYYDLAYCYIPYFGKRLALEMLISAGIIVLCCAILAYGYTRLGRRRSRSSSYLDRWTRGSITRQDPENDTPPTYDDVVVEDKLPSYQDALEMVAKDEETPDGIANPSFQPDSAGAPPTYHDTQPKPTPPAPTTTTTPTPDYTLQPTLAVTTTPTETTNTTLTATDNLSKSEATDTSFPPEGDAREQEEHQQREQDRQQPQQQQEQPAILETGPPTQHPLQTGHPDLNTTTA